MRPAVVPIVAAVVGCGTRDAPPTAPSAALDPPARLAPPAVDVPAGFERVTMRIDASSVGVADPGREPRRVFRYSPVPGTSETLDIRLQNPEQPRVWATVVVEIVAVDAQTIRWRSRLIEARLDDGTAAPGVPAAGTIWAGVSDRQGHSLAIDMVRARRGPSTFDVFPVESSLLWPSDPIGPGARWAVERKGVVRNEREDFEVTADIELKEWAGDHAVVEARARMTGKRVQGTGTGRYEVDAGKLSVAQHGEAKMA